MRKTTLIYIFISFLVTVCNGQILRYSREVAPPEEILVTSIFVFGVGEANTISTDGGTLQMLKKTLPVNATDTTATWSIIAGTGTASIGTSGLVTALTNGTVTVRATANDGSLIYGEEELTISNQTTSTIPAFLLTDTYTKGWYIANTSNLTLDGTEVDVWSDTTANNNDLLIDAGEPFNPTWDSGESAVYFDGVNDQMNDNTFSYNKPITIYTVIKIPSPNGLGKHMFWLYSGPTYDIALVTSNGYQGALRAFDDGVFFNGAEGFFPGDEYFILVWTLNGNVTNGSSLSVNDGTPVTYTGSTTPIEMLRLNHNSTSLEIYMREIIVRNVVDDETSRNAIIDYLNNRWGIFE
jgi:hypothetical protein